MLMNGEDAGLQDIEEGAQDAGYPGALPLDVEKYRKHVEQYDISEKQKLALLQTLWNIMRMFAEIGYGVDSINRFIPALDDFAGEPEGGEARQNKEDCSPDFNGAALSQRQGKENEE